MKKTLWKTLNLKKSTVARLSNDQLTKAKGGTGNGLSTEELTKENCGKPILW